MYNFLFFSLRNLKCTEIDSLNVLNKLIKEMSLESYLDKVTIKIIFFSNLYLSKIFKTKQANTNRKIIFLVL